MGVDWLEEAERDLKEVLDDLYMCIIYRDGKFQIGEFAASGCGDAIFDCDASGETLTECIENYRNCLLYTSPSPRDKRQSRMPSSA